MSDTFSKVAVITGIARRGGSRPIDAVRHVGQLLVATGEPQPGVPLEVHLLEW